MSLTHADLGVGSTTLPLRASEMSLLIINKYTILILNYKEEKENYRVPSACHGYSPFGPHSHSYEMSITLMVQTKEPAQRVHTLIKSLWDRRHE